MMGGMHLMHVLGLAKLSFTHCKLLLLLHLLLNIDLSLASDSGFKPSQVLL